MAFYIYLKYMKRSEKIQGITLSYIIYWHMLIIMGGAAKTNKKITSFANIIH